MAKALGLIGNFKGKLGNTVGYSLKDSNNKQTQGVRVYQPVVRNPKTAAQAEQRAKLAPINATYRALKMVIDRGQEGKAYGNKSRLAWLSDAMKSFNGPWIVKGNAVTNPALVPLTKGSIGVNFVPLNTPSASGIQFLSPGESAPNTIGALSSLIIANYPAVQNGDQITFVDIVPTTSGMITDVLSIVVNTESTDNLPLGLATTASSVSMQISMDEPAGIAVILSREGNNGEHLRNNASLLIGSNATPSLYTEAAKQAAIESYMAAGANTDWAEESIM